MAGLTSSSHVLTGPDWLKADKWNLHRQYESDNVKSAVSWKKKWKTSMRKTQDSYGADSWKIIRLNKSIISSQIIQNQPVKLLFVTVRRVGKKANSKHLMSLSEKMGAGSHHEPGVKQRNWFANAARLIKISYSSWRVRLILEIVVSALGNPFLTHLLLIQDRERWMTRKQTVRPFIKMDIFPFAKAGKTIF